MSDSDPRNHFKIYTSDIGDISLHDNDWLTPGIALERLLLYKARLQPLDSLITLFQIKIRVKKNGTSPYFPLSDCASGDLQVHSCTECKGNGMSNQGLYALKSWIAQSLCKSRKDQKQERGHPTSDIPRGFEENKRKRPIGPIPIPDIYLDCTSHWVFVSKNRQCSSWVLGWKAAPKLMQCNAHLCCARQSNLGPGNCLLKRPSERNLIPA